MPTVARVEQAPLLGFETAKQKPAFKSIESPTQTPAGMTEFQYWQYLGFAPKIDAHGKIIPTRWPSPEEPLHPLATRQPTISCPEVPLGKTKKELAETHQVYQARHRFSRCAEVQTDIDRSPKTKRQKRAISEKRLRADEGLAYFNRVISPLTAVAKELGIKPRIAIKDPEVRKRGHYKENMIRFRGWQTSWRGQKARARTH